MEVTLHVTTQIFDHATNDADVAAAAQAVLRAVARNT
jgi:hypothetical protein